MPAPLPKGRRDRFARLLREGLSARKASRRLLVSAVAGGRWAWQIRSTGAATVAPISRSSVTGKLDTHVGFLLELVRLGPDITFFELRDVLADAEGVTARHSTIATRLKRLGFM